MKIEFKEEHVLFGTLKGGDSFSSLEEPARLFMKIKTMRDPDIGSVNCVDVCDGHPSYFVPGRTVIPRKETVIIE